LRKVLSRAAAAKLGRPPTTLEGREIFAAVRLNPKKPSSEMAAFLSA